MEKASLHTEPLTGESRGGKSLVSFSVIRTVAVVEIPAASGHDRQHSGEWSSAVTLCLADVGGQRPTCCLDSGAVDVVSDVRGSYVECSLDPDLSRDSVDVQPLPRVFADLIPTAEQKNNPSH